MSQHEQRYRELLADWQAFQDGVKVLTVQQEDDLLDRLDESWWKMEPAERHEWDAQTPELAVFAEEPAGGG